MPEHELWFTALFNDYLAGLGNGFLSLIGRPPVDRPWANFVTMQILVVLLLAALFTVLRTRLSMDRPGKLQHTFELIYQFIREQTDEVVGHHGSKYVAFFGTIFTFILFANLLGIVPTFESPTMFPYVPAGCAIAAFFYYNLMGFREQGIGRYLLQFTGPALPLAPIMIPIEIISHLARPLSLTIRLFANMYAGEMVTLVFISLVPVAVPAVFMGLHVFVSLLQAYIFTLLTMVYVAGAVSHEH
ncbi:MAG: F0F1 ATP synthase subunit A [Bryobacterales bacterium]|nr:F0F1 ATP synthase subunit A [Bryobacterales bacterium]